MAVGSADIHRAVTRLWNLVSLDVGFHQFWTTSQQAGFPVLQDTEAGPKQPWPYCIFGSDDASVTTRMSGNADINRREIREVPWMFHVHARKEEDDNNNEISAKEVAAARVEEIMAQYGGHPSIVPGRNLELTNGNALITQYVKDYGIVTGDSEYQWVLQYNIVVDVPVAV